MKRITIGVVTLVLTLALASFATLAAWTDTVTVTDNVINTGTADLKVGTNADGDPTATVFEDGPLSSSMDLGDTTALIPGGTTEKEWSFSLRNDSTTGVNFDLTGTISDVVFSGAASDPADTSSLTITICEWNDATDTCGADIASADLPTWEAGGVDIGSIAAGAEQDYGFYATLDSGAANDWQGQTVTFTFNTLGTFGTP